MASDDDEPDHYVGPDGTADFVPPSGTGMDLPPTWEEIGVTPEYARELQRRPATSGPRNVGEFYEVLRDEGPRIPPGTFLYCDQGTIWVNSKSLEPLLDALMDYTSPGVFRTPPRPLDEFTLFGHRFMTVKVSQNGCEGFYRVANVDILREFVLRLHPPIGEITPDVSIDPQRVLMEQTLTMVAAEWLGTGSATFSAEMSVTEQVAHFVVRYLPPSAQILRRGQGPRRRFRFGMAVPMEMLHATMARPDEWVHHFWENFIEAFREECRRQHYRMKEGAQLTEKLMPQLTQLLESLQEGKDRDHREAVIRQITEIRGRLHDGTYWEEGR